MKTNETFLVVGLTVVLAVVVSLATLGITGHVVYTAAEGGGFWTGPVPPVEKTQTQVFADMLSGATIAGAFGESCKSKCEGLGQQCVLALYSYQDNTELTDCFRDQNQGISFQSGNKLTCMCVSP
jgi:hypothetical protein